MQVPLAIRFVAACLAPCLVVLLTAAPCAEASSASRLRVLQASPSPVLVSDASRPWTVRVTWTRKPDSGDATGGGRSGLAAAAIAALADEEKGAGAAGNSGGTDAAQLTCTIDGEPAPVTVLSPDDPTDREPRATIACGPAVLAAARGRLAALGGTGYTHVAVTVALRSSGGGTVTSDPFPVTVADRLNLRVVPPHHVFKDDSDESDGSRSEGGSGGINNASHVLLWSPTVQCHLSLAPHCCAINVERVPPPVPSMLGKAGGSGSSSGEGGSGDYAHSPPPTPVFVSTSRAVPSTSRRVLTWPGKCSGTLFACQHQDSVVGSASMGVALGADAKCSFAHTPVYFHLPPSAYTSVVRDVVTNVTRWGSGFKVSSRFTVHARTKYSQHDLSRNVRFSATVDVLAADGGTPGQRRTIAVLERSDAIHTDDARPAYEYTGLVTTDIGGTDAPAGEAQVRTVVLLRGTPVQHGGMVTRRVTFDHGPGPTISNEGSVWMWLATASVVLVIIACCVGLWVCRPGRVSAKPRATLPGPPTPVTNTNTGVIPATTRAATPPRPPLPHELQSAASVDSSAAAAVVPATLALPVSTAGNAVPGLFGEHQAVSARAPDADDMFDVERVCQGRQSRSQAATTASSGPPAGPRTLPVTLPPLRAPTPPPTPAPAPNPVPPPTPVPTTSRACTAATLQLRATASSARADVPSLSLGEPEHCAAPCSDTEAHHEDANAGGLGGMATSVNGHGSPTATTTVRANTCVVDEVGLDSDDSSVASGSVGTLAGGGNVEADNGAPIGDTLWAWTTWAVRPLHWFAAEAGALDSDAAQRLGATTPPPRATTTLVTGGARPSTAGGSGLGRRRGGTASAAPTRRPMRSGSTPHLLSASVMLVCAAVALLTSPGVVLAHNRRHAQAVGFNVTDSASSLGSTVRATGERDLLMMELLLAYGLPQAAADKLCRALQGFDDADMAQKLGAASYVMEFGKGFALGAVESIPGVTGSMGAISRAGGVASFVDGLMEKSHTVDAIASLGRSFQDSAALFGRASHPVLKVIALVHISFVVAREVSHLLWAIRQDLHAVSDAILLQVEELTEAVGAVMRQMQEWGLYRTFKEVVPFAWKTAVAVAWGVVETVLGIVDDLCYVLLNYATEPFECGKKLGGFLPYGRLLKFVRKVFKLLRNNPRLDDAWTKSSKRFNFDKDKLDEFKNIGEALNKGDKALDWAEESMQDLIDFPRQADESEHCNGRGTMVADGSMVTGKCKCEGNYVGDFCKRCEPFTCTDLFNTRNAKNVARGGPGVSKVCGQIDDGCGGTLNCDTLSAVAGCTSGARCGVCEDNVCDVLGAKCWSP